MGRRYGDGDGDGDGGRGGDPRLHETRKAKNQKSDRRIKYPVAKSVEEK